MPVRILPFFSLPFLYVSLIGRFGSTNVSTPLVILSCSLPSRGEHDQPYPVSNIGEFDERISAATRSVTTDSAQHAIPDNSNCWPGRERRTLRLARDAGVRARAADSYRAPDSGRGWRTRAPPSITTTAIRSGIRAEHHRPAAFLP